MMHRWRGKLATESVTHFASREEHAEIAYPGSELLFTILDALMILLACLVFNAIHPSIISPQAWAGQVGQGTSLDELHGEKQTATPPYQA